MKKYTLSTEIDLDFLMLGLTCHYRDYRMAWLLNKHVEINLSKIVPYPLFDSKSNTEYEFPLFAFDDKENYISWNLVSNKTPGSIIIPEKKEHDYFLVLKGSFEYLEKGELISKIRNIPGVLLCTEIFPETLKSKKNLYFE